MSNGKQKLEHIHFTTCNYSPEPHAEYGTTREHLSSVAAKNHYHASLNPMAQFPFALNAEAVSKSGIVSTPLRC